MHWPLRGAWRAHSARDRGAGGAGERFARERSARLHPDHAVDGRSDDHAHRPRSHDRADRRRCALRRQGGTCPRGAAAGAGKLRSAARSGRRGRAGLLVQPRGGRSARSRDVRRRRHLGRQQAEDRAGTACELSRWCPVGLRSGGCLRGDRAGDDGGARQRHDLQCAEPAARADAPRSAQPAHHPSRPVARHARRGRPRATLEPRRRHGRSRGGLFPRRAHARGEGPSAGGAEADSTLRCGRQRSHQQ